MLEITKKVETQENVGIRCDVFLSQNINIITRSKLQALAKDGNIFLIRDNEEKKPIYDLSIKTRQYDEFLVIYKEQSTDHITPQNIDIEILYEDDYLIVVNKPANLVVHPGAGNLDNTLVNALLYKYKNKLSTLNGEIRAGIVHRIDKDTSGVLVVAKDDNTHALLSAMFSKHDIQRFYRALVWGMPNPRKGIIDTYINRSKTNRLKMAVENTKKGKRAVTHYKSIKTFDNLLTLVDLELKTGRTHQIRVHMTHIGNSLVGDKIYVSQHNHLLKKLPNDIQILIDTIQRQCLHAYRLGFVHPITKEYINIIKEEPFDIKEIYEKIFENIEQISYTPII